jgi:hypothetical protein
MLGGFYASLPVKKGNSIGCLPHSFENPTCAQAPMLLVQMVSCCTLAANHVSVSCHGVGMKSKQCPDSSRHQTPAQLRVLLLAQAVCCMC